MSASVLENQETQSDMTLVAASVLAADISRLGEEIKAVTQAGADWIHLDVMDGTFVPPITFGDNVVSACRALTQVPLDVHLMIEHPESQIAAFAKAGASRITVHIEACPHLHRVVQRIAESGCKAGVAINPGTTLSSISSIIYHIDLLLVMTVNPGWGGQSYIAESDARIREAAEMIRATGGAVHLEVDGGITGETAKRAVANGADVLVAGTHIFRSKDYRAAISSLKAAH